ncbi:hypothetical protein D3C78_869060 [compost metagenome]
MHPARDLHVGKAGKLVEGLEIGDRQYPRHYLGIDADGGAAITKAQVGLHIEEELGNGAVGTGIYLALEVEQVGLRAPGFGVALRIGGHRDVEVGLGLEQGDQIGGIHVRLVESGGQVTAQCHYVANAAVPVVTGNGSQLVAAGIDTGQVRCGDEAGALLDVLDHLVRTIPGARVGAIGHGDKLGFQHLQSFDGLPEGILHPFTVGGKKLEADRNVVTQVSQTLVECLNLTRAVKSHLLSPCPTTDSCTSKRMFGRLNVFLSL